MTWTDFSSSALAQSVHQAGLSVLEKATEITKFSVCPRVFSHACCAFVCKSLYNSKNGTSDLAGL